MDMKILFGVILVTLGTSKSKSIHTEPMCTRFSYDELLLEKMIKIEHKTGVMMDSFNEISVEVKSDLERMTGEFDKIQRDAKALSAEGHENIENRKSRFDEMIKEQEEKIAETVLRETEKYKKEISDLKEQANRSSYAFSAYWLSETVPSPTKDLIFTRTLLDTDGVYNNRTGKFTVPYSGVYIFFATLCADGGKSAWVEIRTEETFIGRMHTGDNNWSTCSSGSAVAHLQAEKQVFMRVTSASYGNVFYNSETQGTNSFSGYLIKQD